MKIKQTIKVNVDITEIAIFYLCILGIVASGTERVYMGRGSLFEIFNHG